MSHVPPPSQSSMPPTLNYAPPPERTDLRTIAVRQKVILYCILGYLVLAVGRFLVPPEVGIVMALAGLAVSITGAVFVFMLTLSLYNTAAGVILGILTLIPLIGLFVLLIINNKATAVLRKHNIQVGLLGAKTSQIPAPGQVPMQ